MSLSLIYISDEGKKKEKRPKQPVQCIMRLLRGANPTRVFMFSFIVFVHTLHVYLSSFVV